MMLGRSPSAGDKPLGAIGPGAFDRRTLMLEFVSEGCGETFRIRAVLGGMIWPCLALRRSFTQCTEHRPATTGIRRPTVLGTFPDFRCVR